MSAKPRDVAETIRLLPSPYHQRYSISASPPPHLSTPPYSPQKVDGPRIGLAVASMARHSTDEGWQLFQGLNAAGYDLCGYGVSSLSAQPNGGWHHDDSDVKKILAAYQPSVVVIQDKREWEGRTAGPGFDQRERFQNVTTLKDQADLFKLTVLKDAQHSPEYHRESMDEIGCHAVIYYYHPEIVYYLAPYVRSQHLIRTYHTIDKTLVPPFGAYNRDGCLISGAVSGAYPLRTRFIEATRKGLLPGTQVLPHPGYGRARCYTPDFLKILSQFKVAVCTSSLYGYALRKIVEATACGCRVITDLPTDEVLPKIDGNLLRVHPSITETEMTEVIKWEYSTYDTSLQEWYSKEACDRYDFRVEGKRLADSIETMRRSYP